MAITEKATVSLAHKLQEFRGKLDEGEQDALDGLLKSFHGAARRATSEKDVRAAGEEISRLNALLQSADDEGVVAIGPTITTVTITTTVASHPIITCN